MSAEKRLAGKLPREAFGMLDIPRFPKEIIDGYQALADLTGTVSDVLDKLGIAGVIPASTLRPTIPGTRMVGPALTVHNIAQEIQPHKGAVDEVSKLSEAEAHNLAEPGDVLVIRGIDGVSNMGGFSSTTGKRQGQLGAIVDGGVRDVEHQRRIGYPVWSRSVTPVTGKWRVETVQINGPVEIAGVRVNPGDLVLADDSGICFVPRGLAAEVLAIAKRIDEMEAVYEQDVLAGMPVPELVKRLKELKKQYM